MFDHLGVITLSLGIFKAILAVRELMKQFPKEIVFVGGFQ
jgi:hypothetical protein